MFIPELLAPAGNLTKLKTALLYNADAVYLGGDEFNLRSSATGFTEQELKIGLQEAENFGSRVYYCLNSLPFEHDIRRLPSLVEKISELGVHAFIVADPGILRIVKKYAPDIPVHLSTQANTTNSSAVKFWKEQGIGRINLARELNLLDIKSIRELCPTVELEIFVHGAMCLAVSGQCLLSAWLNQRPANLGRCTHPCRFEYKGAAWENFTHDAKDLADCTPPGLVVEEKIRPGQELWTIQQDEKYSSFWAPEDLCLLPYLPWFSHNRINAIKIEGRTKSAAYVAQVVDVYRTALDDFSEGNFKPAKYMRELVAASFRPFTSGFFVPQRRQEIGKELFTKKTQGLPTINGTTPAYALLGRVLEAAGPEAWRIDVLGTWQKDLPVELMLPGMRRPLLTAKDYQLENHRQLIAEYAGSGTQAILHTATPGITPGIFIRAAGNQQ